MAIGLIAGLGVAAEAVREAIGGVLGPAQRKKAPYYPFAHEVIKALELAKREAMRMGDDHIGTEHILLGVLRDQKSLGVKRLAGLGITRKEIERADRPVGAFNPGSRSTPPIRGRCRPRSGRH